MALRWIILFFGLGLAAAKLTGDTETDVDEGHDWDILDINEAAGLDLLEGDIEEDETFSRNSIIGDKYRWPTTIPYYLEDSLEMNAKGVILKAFDQYRLKTCIDFTPWKGEKNYISVYKGSGCSSSVGNRRVGKQRLSIGRGCDGLGTVEHEFLHALGFWHEQSRADRDDYVDIMWDRIEPGKDHNFRKYDDTVSSALGVPYDYGSVMHYSKMSFNIGSDPTIVTKIPHFMDVIGQRMGFSASDLAKLNRLYNCSVPNKVAAYKALSNKEKRKLYDSVGHEAFLKNEGSGPNYPHESGFPFCHKEPFHYGHEEPFHYGHEEPFPFGHEEPFHFHNFNDGPFVEDPYMWSFHQDGEAGDVPYEHYSFAEPGFGFFYGDEDEEDHHHYY